MAVSSRFSVACFALAFASLPMVALAQAKKPAKPAVTPPSPAPSSAAPPATPTTDAADQKKADAKQRFEKAMGLFEQEVWDGALAEFLQSRASYPTRGNTQNAAICLRTTKRSKCTTPSSESSRQS
jgi:hypothetical protein